MLSSCQEKGDILTQKDLRAQSSSPELWINIYYAQVEPSWAWLPAWPSVIAEDVPLLSPPVPHGFHWLALQLWLLVTEQITTLCVSMCACGHIFLSVKCFCKTPRRMSTIASVCLVSLLCVCTNLLWYTEAHMCMFSCNHVHLYGFMPSNEYHIYATKCMCVYMCDCLTRLSQGIGCLIVHVCVSVSYGCGERAEVWHLVNVTE